MFRVFQRDVPACPARWISLARSPAWSSQAGHGTFYFLRLGLPPSPVVLLGVFPLFLLFTYGSGSVFCVFLVCFFGSVAHAVSSRLSVARCGSRCGTPCFVCGIASPPWWTFDSARVDCVCVLSWAYPVCKYTNDPVFPRASVWSAVSFGLPSSRTSS